MCELFEILPFRDTWRIMGLVSRDITNLIRSIRAYTYTSTATLLITLVQVSIIGLMIF